jgi:hypothetical protein
MRVTFFTIDIDHEITSTLAAAQDRSSVNSSFGIDRLLARSPVSIEGEVVATNAQWK